MQRRKHSRSGIKLPFLADILDIVVSLSVKKFVISHNWGIFLVMVPLSHVGPQGSILGPFLGPIFPGYRALEVYFMMDGVSYLNFWSFNYNEAEKAILSRRTPREGGLLRRAFFFANGWVNRRWAHHWLRTFDKQISCVVKSSFSQPKLLAKVKLYLTNNDLQGFIHSGRA